MKWFVLGDLPHTVMKRYAVLDHGCIVDVTVSVPLEGEEVPRPASLRFKRNEAIDVRVKQPNAQTFSYSTKANGEQPRRPTWKRSGKRVAPQ